MSVLARKIVAFKLYYFVALVNKRSFRSVVPKIKSLPNDREVATPGRFERSTYCLEGSCSIQLSYGANSFILAYFSKIVKEFIQIVIVLDITNWLPC